MLTEDIQLPNDGSWLGLVPTADYMVVYNGSNRDCLIRYGALSTSFGMLFESDTTILVAETIYIKPKVLDTNRKTGSIRISR